jgi:hypothetical protein
MHNIQITSKLCLAWATLHEARDLYASQSNVRFISVDACSRSCSNPSDLGRIYWFSQFLENTLRSSTNEIFVLCAGHDPQTISSCSVLLGSYLILMLNRSLEVVVDIFRPISDYFRAFKEPSANASLRKPLTVMDCWRALYQAKRNCWLDFTGMAIDQDKTIDMEEYLHYDNPAQGTMHVIIPSTLIGIRCPTDLEQFAACPARTPEQTWFDFDGERYFGPEFYADVLRADYNVALLVRCSPSPAAGARTDDSGRAAGYDDSAFLRSGIAFEELAARLHHDGTPTFATAMRDVDRFLTLAVRAPGAIALHGPAGTSLGTGGELLVSALLMQRHGFDAAAALAWLRIVHPPAAPAHLSFSVSPRRLAAAMSLAGPSACAPALAELVAGRFRRCRSAPSRGLTPGGPSFERAISVPDVFERPDLNTRLRRHAA